MQGAHIEHLLHKINEEEHVDNDLENIWDIVNTKDLVDTIFDYAKN